MINQLGISRSSPASLTNTYYATSDVADLSTGAPFHSSISDCSPYFPSLPLMCLSLDSLAEDRILSHMHKNGLFREG
jgi:hypothetical protein